MDNIEQVNRELKGKRVVILGGTAGIGKATAQAVVAAGGQIVVASSKKKNIDATVQHLGKEHEGHVVDLSEERNIRAFFEKVGGFDHLVFTAGESLLLGPLLSTEVQVARKFFDVRFWGALAAVKYAIPHINKGGSITLTGGLSAHRPSPGWSIGASICAAMEGFTRAMAVELAPLRVNMVVPGLVRTDLWSSFSVAEREKMFTDFGGSLPVGKVGEPEELAKAYLFLITQTFATGQCIIVDGGGALV
ncbi:MAG TPA: SDR family oxidoreductase [Cyclobacteriaceae bacterium]|jgi:NAD(P)-dependent dehydrogenase (short-subunit alcohol dehydrogenase family)|nr:SDR family oxidoreductase [Cyclobacteriaceae bacterium]